MASQTIKQLVCRGVLYANVRLFYAGLAVAVMGGLLAPGFVLTLDMIFTPQPYLPSVTQSSYLFYALLKAMHLILPMTVIQKIVLLSIVYVAGLGMHRFGSSLLDMCGLKDRARHLSLYLAGTFFVINPFTYSRFMAGQFAVLLGYALLPWFMLHLLRFHHQPNSRRAVYLGLVTAVVAIVSVHTLGMIMLAGLVALLLQLYHSRHRLSDCYPYIRYGGIAVGVAVVLCLNWLGPLLVGHGQTQAIVERFNAQDQTAFATVGPHWLFQIINILHLQGFWVEGRSMYVLPQGVNPLWGIVSTILLLLVLTGFRYMWRLSRDVTVYFGTLMGCATLVALGSLRPLARLMPLFEGYREPHKFVGLVALGFSVSLLFAVYQLLIKYKRRQLIWASGFLILIVLFTPTMLGGFDGQLKPTNYPLGWQRVNQKLQADNDQFNTMFLPWHQYMSFGFTGDRTVINPAPRFFAKPILSSDNMEFKDIAHSSNDKRLIEIEQWLKQPADPALPQKLAHHDVKYIILAHELDYKRYNKLVQQSHFTKLYSDSNVSLYLNKAWR